MNRCGIPCPWCGSYNARPIRRVGLLGEWPDMALRRRYKCEDCQQTFHTLELSEEEPITPYCSLERSESE